jgi:hypothetical protein
MGDTGGQRVEDIRRQGACGPGQHTTKSFTQVRHPVSFSLYGENPSLLRTFLSVLNLIQPHRETCPEESAASSMTGDRKMDTQLQHAALSGPLHHYL